MERRGNVLGYVAIGLGALALVVALLGGPSRSQVSIQVPWVAEAPVAPEDPAARAAPVPPIQPARPEGPGIFKHELEQEWRFHGHGPWSANGWGQFAGWHGPGLFMWPFMFLGSLIKLGLALLAIMLGLRLLRGRRGPGGAPPQAPPPTPPHTGPTAYL